MNPLVHRQLQRIDAALRTLSKSIDNAQENAQLRRQEFEALQKEVWSQRKRITTLQRISQDYDALSDENDRLRTLHAQLRERLRGILTHVKTLGKEVQS